MLPVKRGISSLSRASSSRNVTLGTSSISGSCSRRFYADDSNSKDANNSNTNKNKNNNNDDDTSQVKYRRMFSVTGAPPKLDPQTNPFARGVSPAEKAIIDDILRPRSQRRPAAPDSPPRARHLLGRIKPAPFAGGANVNPEYSFPSQRSVRESTGVDEADGMDILSDESDGGTTRDDAARKASDVFALRKTGSSTVLNEANYHLTVTARSKNCIMTLTDEQSRWVASWSSGMCGFRNAAEGSYEAGYQCAIHIFEKMREEIKRRSEEVKLEIYLNGFGQGRSALLKALTMSEGDGVREVVSKLTDTTPIRIGGTRLQKARRL